MYIYTHKYMRLYIYNISMYADAAISDIARRQKSFWEIFSHRRFCRSIRWDIPLKAPAQRKAGLASRSVARCSFRDARKWGVWKMGFQFVFPLDSYHPGCNWGEMKGFGWNPGIPKVINLVLDDLPPICCSTCSALTS